MLILQKSWYFCSWEIVPKCGSPPERPPIVSVHQLMCYFLTPCLLLPHQFLQLWRFLISSLLVLQHHCCNLEDCTPPEKEPDDPKTAADTQREYSYDYLHSPVVGAVTKNICKNFGKCRYCWVIRMLGNLVPVCSNVARLKEFYCISKFHTFIITWMRKCHKQFCLLHKSALR